MTDFKTKLAIISVVAAVLFVVPVLVPIASDLVGQASTTGSQVTIGDDNSNNLHKTGQLWSNAKGGYKSYHQSFTPKKVQKKYYDRKSRRYRYYYSNEKGYVYWEWKNGVPVSAPSQQFELFVTWPNNEDLSSDVSVYVLQKDNKNKWNYHVNNVKIAQNIAPSGPNFEGTNWQKVGGTFNLLPNKQTRVYLLASSGQKFVVDAVMLKTLSDCGNEKTEGGEDCDDGNEDPNDGCHKCKYRCYDSDLEDENNPGYVIGMNDGRFGKYEDYCGKGQMEGKVIEYLCAENGNSAHNIDHKVMDCEYGCNDGACLKKPLCKQAGEAVSTMPRKDDEDRIIPECCEGLERIKIVQCEDLACYEMSDGFMCSDCGNGECEQWENFKNCPDDCKPPCAKEGQVVYGDSVPGPKLCCDDLEIRPWGCEAPDNGSEGICVDEWDCGNGKCDEGEDECNCEKDCGSCEEDKDCPSGKTCYDGECVPWGKVCPRLGEVQCYESKENGCDGIWFDDYGPEGLECCCSEGLCPVVQGDDDDDDEEEQCPSECDEFIDSNGDSVFSRGEPYCKMDNGREGVTRTYGDYKCCCNEWYSSCINQGGGKPRVCMECLGTMCPEAAQLIDVREREALVSEECGEPCSDDDDDDVDDDDDDDDDEEDDDYEEDDDEGDDDDDDDDDDNRSCEEKKCQSGYNNESECIQEMGDKWGFDEDDCCCRFVTIEKISNANPDSNGSAVPVGQSEIGAFRFDLTETGMDYIALIGLAFNVNATNVALDANKFKLYNKNDSTTTHTCYTYSYPNTRQITGVASGSLLVTCHNMDEGEIRTELGAGGHRIFVLSGEILDQNTSTTGGASTLQVSFQKFNDEDNASFADKSHIYWKYKNDGQRFMWLDYDSSIIKSTSYES